MNWKLLCIFAVVLAILFASKQTWKGYETHIETECKAEPIAKNLRAKTPPMLLGAPMANIDNTYMQPLFFNGPFSGKNFDAQHLTVNGSAEIREVIIRKSTQINGALDVKQSTFYGPVQINGLAIAENSIFNNTITLSGSLEFHNSRAQDIEINNTKEKTGSITLSGNSLVKGTITFKHAYGEVIVKDTAQVEGTLVNGIMVQK